MRVLITPTTFLPWLSRTSASRNLPMISYGRDRFFAMPTSSSDRSKKH